MIRFDEVTKVYDRKSQPALHDVTAEVERGEFVFLVGASGSGKSTFIRLVQREERASSGSVHVLGRDLSRIPSWKVPQLRRQLGVVFQDFRLLPQKTVFANVAFAMQVLGKRKAFIRQEVLDVLKMVGLEGKDKRMPHELSGGEQQRVAIARAVVNRPAILLADEPTGNLDPETSWGIMDVLDKINQNGTTVVMATHDYNIVNTMPRRVIELVDGEVVRDETHAGYAPTEAEKQNRPEVAEARDDSATLLVADETHDSAHVVDGSTPHSEEFLPSEGLEKEVNKDADDHSADSSNPASDSDSGDDATSDDDSTAKDKQVKS